MLKIASFPNPDLTAFLRPHSDSTSRSPSPHLERNAGRQRAHENPPAGDTLPTSKKNTLEDPLYSAPIRPPVSSGKVVTFSSVSASPPLPEDFANTSAAISRLLQRQPDLSAHRLQSIDPAAFRKALHQAFPDAIPAIDPDHIYVTHYTDVFTATAQGDIPERRPASSLTLSQALQAAIANATGPTYNQSRTGFFHCAHNTDDANAVAAMKGTRPLLSFERILQDAVNHSIRVGMPLYQQSLQAFWNTHDHTLDPAQTPASWLAEKYGALRLAEAQLRVNDDTLTNTSMQWLRAAASKPGAVAMPGTFALSLQDDAKNIPFSGVAVFTQSPTDHPDTASGPILLMIPGQGLMEFSSASHYRQALQQWFDTTEPRNVLLKHVALEERERVAGLDNSVAAASPFRYRAITGPLFIDLIQSQLAQQMRDLACHAGCTKATRRDSIDNLQAAFATDGIVQMRQQRLLQKFLQQADAHDKREWFKEIAQYRMALQKTQTSGLPAMQQYLDPSFLPRQANSWLRQRIKQDLQLDLDPDKVVVTTYQLLLTYPLRGDLPTPPGTEMARKVASSVTLTDLALANTPPLEQSWGGELPVHDEQGKLLPQLTRDYLIRMIRSANVGQRYQELLQGRLLDSPEATARERAYAQFLQAQLQLDAREAKINGSITAEAMRRVQAAAQLKPGFVNRLPVLARDLQIGGNRVTGVMLFATLPPDSITGSLLQVHRHPGAGIAKVILYTPGAPDNVRLREYASRAQMNKDFINNPAMHDYLVQRIELGNQGKVRNLLQHGASDADVRDLRMPGNFLHAAYRQQAGHIIADATARTTTNEQVDRMVWWDRLNIALDIAGIFLPLKISLPLSLLRAAHAFYNANEAHQNNNEGETLLAFLNGINLLANAAIDGTSSTLYSAPRSYPTRGSRTTPGHYQQNSEAAITTNTTPANMTSVQIEGKTYFYWSAPDDLVHYRDLFVRDPLHPDQLKAAGKGAPNEQQLWKKFVPAHMIDDNPPPLIPGAAKAPRLAIGSGSPLPPAPHARILWVPVTPPATPKLTTAPTGMQTVQIDGRTCFYWPATRGKLGYPELFELFDWDPLRQNQLRRIGYGAPDVDNVWKLSAPLQGGGNRQIRGQAPEPESSAHEATDASPAIKKVPVAWQHLWIAKIDGKEVEIRYNLEQNAFRRTKPIDDTSYQLRNNKMQEQIGPPRAATDAEREASLRTLGIELRMPLDFKATKPRNAAPIPNAIRCIWVGDQRIPDELVINLRRNADIAASGKKKYSLNVYLSTKNLEMFIANSMNLRVQAPRVNVFPLEESRFYKTFMQNERGKYFTQYEAALNGNGGIASNYASAADILRYRLLFHEGGLYMDVDDRLIGSIGDIDIKTSPSGLALGGPVSMKSMGLDAQFSNSIFGTQKHNPTLNAISEESYRRYLQNQDLYTQPRPRKSTHTEQQVDDYMKRISYVTGPHVFSHVITERLPDMHQMLEAIKLRRDSSIDIPLQMETAIDKYEAERLPLADFSRPGNAHTWYEHR